MAKTKQQKEQMLSKLDYLLTEANGAVLVDYQGLTVKATEELRGKLAEQKAAMVIAKNTLLRRAMATAEVNVPADILDRPLAIIYSPQDEVVPAKTAVNFAKDNEALELLGGMLSGRFISTAQVTSLASLPSVDQLRGQVVGTIAAPLSQFVGVLHRATSSLVNVLATYERTLNNA